VAEERTQERDEGEAFSAVHAGKPRRLHFGEGCGLWRELRMSAVSMEESAKHLVAYLIRYRTAGSPEEVYAIDLGERDADKDMLCLRRWVLESTWHPGGAASIVFRCPDA